MPVVAKSKKLYELLVRFAVDGTTQGAHAQYREIITVDGELVKDEVLPAEPLSIENFAESSVMGEVTQQALQDVTLAKARIEALEELLNEKTHNLDEAIRKVAKQGEKIVDMQELLVQADAAIETANEKLRQRIAADVAKEQDNGK